MSQQSSRTIEADKSRAPDVKNTLLIRGERLAFIILKQQTSTHGDKRFQINSCAVNISQRLGTSSPNLLYKAILTAQSCFDLHV